MFVLNSFRPTSSPFVMYLCGWRTCLLEQCLCVCLCLLSDVLAAAIAVALLYCCVVIRCLAHGCIREVSPSS